MTSFDMYISGISFTPREVGEHLVNVFRNGQHINGSPFKIMVGESELGNASKVRVAGQGLQNGMANEVNEFMVDTRDAGKQRDSTLHCCKNVGISKFSC
jgi:filamin